MKIATAMRTLVAASLVLVSPSLVAAESLSDGIEGLFGERGIALDVDRSNLPHRAHFTSESLATFALLVKQLSASAADFPAVSTAPGFTYRYDPRLEVFERSTSNLGPAFVERPQTLGQGKLDVGFSYLYIAFDELDGEGLDGLSFRGLSHNDCCNPQNPPPSPGTPAFEIDTADLRYEEFDLTSHVFVFNATYGLTDRWDLNVLVPVLHTSLDLRARATLNNESGSNTHFFDQETAQTVEERSFDDETVGVGDVQVRSKYRLLDREGLNASSGLGLRVPTGDEDDFQGLGDATLTPFVSLSYEWERIDTHASGGIEVNLDDTDRSRVRYAGGVSFQIVEAAALFVDVIGSSNLATDRLSVTVPQFVNAPGTSEAPPTTIPSTVRAHKNVATTLVDLAPGVKAALAESLVAYFTAFVPLNDDGLRADFIPAGGFELTF